MRLDLANWILVLSALLASASTGVAAKRAEIELVSVEDTALATMLLAARGAKQPVLLFDQRDRESLSAYAATWDGPVHCFQRPATQSAEVAAMKAAAGGACSVVGDLAAFARTLWPKAQSAVVVPAGQDRWLMQAAAFAGATGSLLLPLESGGGPPADIIRKLRMETVYLPRDMPDWRAAAEKAGVEVIEVSKPDALIGEWLRLRKDTSPTAVVVANPSDRQGFFSPSGLSLLAPLVGIVRGAPLVLTTGADPALVEAETREFIDAHQLHPSHIILVGDELGLRSHLVPDPVQEAGGPEARGGGIAVRVELFSEIQLEQPQDFAVGRIVAESASQASVVLARQLYGHERRKRKSVVFLANADEIFALGETISRTTAKEFDNVGVPVRAYYRKEITTDVIKRALKEANVLVWEGHPRDLTLEERGGITLRSAPKLVVLQGCYTLDRSDPFILIEKGSDAIVATSAAIYSASGSAFARALFDGLLYRKADLGVAVRDARNYLLALAKLKRLRGHADWRKTYRAALAFALWGDPTGSAPLEPASPVRQPVQWTMADGKLSLTIPERSLGEVAVGRYRATPAPGVMLGGLLLRHGNGKERYLKELYFTAQPAPPNVASACPPGIGWQTVSLFAPRTKTLTVLARPDWTILETSSKRNGRFPFPLAVDPASCP